MALSITSEARFKGETERSAEFYASAGERGIERSSAPSFVEALERSLSPVAAGYFAALRLKKVEPGKAEEEAKSEASRTDEAKPSWRNTRIIRASGSMKWRAILLN